MQGIYLGAFKAFHPGFDIVYQDINGKRDLPGDMMDVDLTPYDFIIATPPCNFWSRAQSFHKFPSKYALETKHLLIDILNKLCKLDKPFIVENVCNDPLFTRYGLFDLPCHIYKVGNHTYWSNCLLPGDIESRSQNKQFISRSARQGGFNVHNVIEVFLNGLF